MFTSYEDSVYAYTDAEGKLSVPIIKQLFDEHGSNLSEFLESTGDNWDDAEVVLNWLGY